jgi:hypothetical protein
MVGKSYIAALSVIANPGPNIRSESYALSLRFRGQDWVPQYHLAASRHRSQNGIVPPREQGAKGDIDRTRVAVYGHQSTYRSSVGLVQNCRAALQEGVRCGREVEELSTTGNKHQRLGLFLV